MNGWRRCGLYTMEYYSATKRNGFESVLMRRMNLVPVTHDEGHQKEKDSYPMLTLIKLPAEQQQRPRYWERTWGEGGESGMHGGSSTETHTAVCRSDSQRGLPADSAQTRAWKQPRGWGAAGGRRGLRRQGHHGWTWGCSMLLFGANQCNFVKQLSFPIKSEFLKVGLLQFILSWVCVDVCEWVSQYLSPNPVLSSFCWKWLWMWADDIYYCLWLAFVCLSWTGYLGNGGKIPEDGWVLYKQWEKDSAFLFLCLWYTNHFSGYLVTCSFRAMLN